jgi:hypothetical protein
MSDFDAQKDEDDGYKKPAGPWWAYTGLLLGFPIAAVLWWYIESHH